MKVLFQLFVPAPASPLSIILNDKQHWKYSQLQTESAKKLLRAIKLRPGIYGNCINILWILLKNEVMGFMVSRKISKEQNHLTLWWETVYQIPSGFKVPSTSLLGSQNFENRWRSSIFFVMSEGAVLCRWVSIAALSRLRIVEGHLQPPKGKWNSKYKYFW